MTFALPALPYELNALEPYISAKTMDFHYNKHHKAYIDKVNRLIVNSDFANQSLLDIVRNAHNKNIDVHNNAAQAINHEFFWSCLTPSGGGAPKLELAQRINADFGSNHAFVDAFKNKALNLFGSGWVWLCLDKQDKLDLITTHNGDNPISQGLKPIVTLDLWEHAYYLDFQNERGRFVDAFLEHLINWDFAALNLKSHIPALVEI